MQKIFRFIFLLLMLSVANHLFAMGNNIAPLAQVTVSSSVDEQSSGKNLTDGIIRIVNKGNWVSKSQETFWGEIDLPWARLDWNQEVYII